VRLKLCELSLDGSRNLRIERLDDLARFLLVDVEESTDLRR
jgi:hypothetical protein